MTFEMLKIVFDKGNNRGSAFRRILSFYGIEDYDLSKITNEMAENWIKLKEGICMTSKTTREIKNYSTNRAGDNAILALLDYYKKTALMNISEQQALVFLGKLKSGEIKL